MKAINESYQVVGVPASAPLRLEVTEGPDFIAARVNGEPWLRVAGPDRPPRDTFVWAFRQELERLVSGALSG